MKRETLGEYLSEVRPRYRNQTDMASAAGLNQPDLSKILRDEQNLEWPTLQKLIRTWKLEETRAIAAYKETKHRIETSRNPRLRQAEAGK